MNFTKGEWEQVGSIIMVYGETGGIICSLAEPRKTHLVEFYPLELGSKDWDEQMANANLISAAPDMYEALKEAKDRFGNYNLFWVEKVGAALAKAEGKRD